MAYKIPTNWDKISDEKRTNINIIGGHECIIVSVTEHETKDGEESLKVNFDIADGDEFAGIFTEKYYSNGRKWLNEGTKYFSYKEQYLNYFKAFIRALEESNNVKINVTPGEEIDYSQFEGLKIGGIFILEEYQKDGKLRVGSILSEFVSLDELSEERTDTIKLLDGTYINYDEYKNHKNINS